jgi:hypothetical protein
MKGGFVSVFTNKPRLRDWRIGLTEAENPNRTDLSFDS